MVKKNPAKAANLAGFAFFSLRGFALSESRFNRSPGVKYPKVKGLQILPGEAEDLLVRVNDKKVRQHASGSVQQSVGLKDLRLEIADGADNDNR